MVTFLVSYRFSEYWWAIKRNPDTLFTAMHSTAFHNHLMEILNDNNFKAMFPSCWVSKIYLEGHPNNVLWNFDNGQDRKWQHGTKPVFGLLLPNRWEQRDTRDMSSLLEFRHRILRPLIDPGLEVNLHIWDFYSWDPSIKSTYLNLLVELIRNGLSNFVTSCSVSMASMLIFGAFPEGRRSGPRWSNVHLLTNISTKSVHRAR